MIQEIDVNGCTVKMWAEDLDGYAMNEVQNIASLPFIFKHIALMPDVHAGKGMPIGCVLATKNVVIPNAVGVDIGCGMCAVKSDIKMEQLPPEILRKQIMRGIRKRIPLGRERHKKAQDESLMPQFENIGDLTVVQRRYESALKQIGTLGGGNHFIELQRDTEDNLWVMIHSGSRNLGNEVCNYYDEKAKKFNALFHSKVSADMNLAFLPMQMDVAKQYWAEMEYCVAFAHANRNLMIQRIQEVIRDSFPDVSFEPTINIAHNYAAWENHFEENVIVHRKGAVHAGLDEIGIIPGSQGTKSYIVRGLGNVDSFCSSSHGAGRALSRTEACNTLSLEEEKAHLDSLGIVHAVRYQQDLDEATGAYKDIHVVMKNQEDLVQATVELSPIAVIKG
jgi:tRNA-splicing ligase RtcB